MEITYTEGKDGFYYPNLIAPTNAGGHIGTWGRLRLRCLKEHRRITYTVMKMEGALRRHLVETDRQATECFETIVAQMMESQGIDEKLKAQDQMAWVGAVNNIRSTARGLVFAELIYD